MPRIGRKSAAAPEPEEEQAVEEQVSDVELERPAAKGMAAAPDDEEDDNDEGDEEEDGMDEAAVIEVPAEVAAAAPVVEVPAPAPAPAPKKNEPRLMIRTITLENFKSYGGRRVIGPFHKSFSSIVGPNGSGKSNTIDALLFVFGKRAKKIRLNKISELIHCSKGHEKLPSAKVEVVFQDIIDTGDGPTDYKVVEGSELKVGREAFRNNQSKYYLDDKPSNFTDVNAILRKRGVDLEHNRFLILQGEVESISMMKPKALTPHEDGLLEYLEDIIGSNKYIEKIEQAEQLTEQLTEKRNEKLNRLRLAERERDGLDGPRKEAEAWVTAEGERLELQAVLAQAAAHQSHANLQDLEKEHKVLQGHMEKHRKKMEGYEKEVKAIEAEHNEQLKTYNGVKTQMEKAAAEFKEFERQDVRYTEDIACCEQKLVKLKQASVDAKENAQKLVEEAKQLREDAPKREQELESAERFKEAQQKKLEKIYEGLKDKAEELRVPKEKKEAELVPLQKRLTEVRKVVEVAQTEAQLLREKTTKITEQIEEVKHQQAECGQRLSTCKEEAAEAAKIKKERSKLVSEARSRLAEVTTQMEAVSQEVTATRIKSEEAKASFVQEQDRGRLIRAVYEQSKAGRLKGVHGRLGDLGTIDKKYDVAVSTACGMLDAIVVDTTEDAQKVIEFVRQQDLGRTTCISLQQIQGRKAEMERAVETPEKAPRLVDLVQPNKPEYKVAFFFALQHTLVAKNLEQATRLGMQGRTRWRVVTLDGKLVDTSGTMSGGGGKVASGGMRASLCMYSPEEVKSIVEAYERANAKLAQIRQEKKALEEALTLTDKEISEVEIREKKSSMEIASLQKQMAAYDERLKSMKVPTLSGGEKSKLKELEKLINERSKELSKIQEEHQKVESQVHELHNRIMNIGGEELKTAKAKVEESTKKVEDMRKYIKKALLDADIMDKNAKKAEESEKAAQKDHAKTEKELAKLKEEHAKLDDKAESVLNNYNKLKEALVEQDTVLTKLRSKRDEVIQAASQLKSQEVDLVNEMEEKTRVLRELYAKVTHWGNKLQEARKEYAQLPLDLLSEIRKAEEDRAAEGTIVEAGEPPRKRAAAASDRKLGQRAIAEDLSESELKAVKTADVEARMLQLEANLKNLRPNLSAIEEFRRADGEHKLRLSEYEDVNGQRENARKELETLRQQRLENFMEGFSVISMKLKEMYQMITLGGDAELELVDTLDPFSEGINFSVRPPNKSWKQITNLSGGEKTLASLSLVFALHHYKPTPLYFMDEIDAALDFRNVSIIANYIKERTRNAQFIIISLRNHMFEMADLLVGIYKTSDMSKSVAIDPLAFEVKRPPGGGMVIQDKDANYGKRAAAPIQGPAASNKGRKTAH
eukprot:gnl/TRDRNA2_/TRDRNA2_63218_c0_seq1.p1 gnl/TRDRNA2_/TRDRNA2_63218_c0~~gnl/TRDRNA2_/TRDRNA2_63218_c0_seq1.p1  ORF type:complete len:1377 (+),score=498.50 gnl/TRDRNA2_/TRDRNA2_63218_c0_seq1:64-4194(+)